MHSGTNTVGAQGCFDAVKQSSIVWSLKKSAHPFHSQKCRIDSMSREMRWKLGIASERGVMESEDGESERERAICEMQQEAGGSRQEGNWELRPVGPHEVLTRTHGYLQGLIARGARREEQGDRRAAAASAANNKHSIALSCCCCTAALLLLLLCWTSQTRHRQTLDSLQGPLQPPLAWHKLQIYKLHSELTVLSVSLPCLPPCLLLAPFG